MNSINRQTVVPLQVPRTNRNHNVVGLTSFPAAKCAPVAAIPLLREDAAAGSMRIAVEMAETKELLMNGAQLRVTAWVVPWLAFERFEGSRDQFDRSYMGQPQIDGGDVIPFFEAAAMGAHGSKAIYKTLGLHAKTTDEVNTMYAEAYNLIWNYRAKNRSKEITPRSRLDYTLAPAFWLRGRFEHVVPDFDQAVIDGQVALNVVESRMPVKGLGLNGTAQTQTADIINVRSTDGDIVTYDEGWQVRSDTDALGAGSAWVAIKAQGNGHPDIWAELQQNGITVSLSNIEQARKTQAFAKLREKFAGFDDEYIIDMLMGGLQIPDQFLKQPIMLADQRVAFRQAKRYATDAENLAESAVSGMASLNLRVRVPRMSTGGVIMVIAEALPEQLFERQRDPFFFAQTVEELPEFLRDFLDSQKVDDLLNGEVDTDHATPNGTFGYWPLNAKWTSFGPRVGGKFYRPTTNTTTDDERQRLWAVETVNPSLSEDFYLATAVHQKPFLDPEADPFEATVIGNAVINGNTQFGPMLIEASENYDAVQAKAPTEQIDVEG